MKSKIYLVVAFVCLYATSVTAQKGYYSNTAQFISEVDPFPKNSLQKKYQVENDDVVEYYDAETKGFIGYYSEIESLNIQDLKIIQNNPNLKKMLRDVALDEALHFIYDKVSPGMNVDEVIAILGKPDKFKYAISGNNQLLYYFYVDRDFEKLVFKDDVLVSVF